MSWIQHHTACFETTTIAQKTCRRKHEVPSCQEPSTQFRFLSKRKGSSMCRRESPHWSNQLKHCSVILEWRLSLHESIYIYIYTETNFKGLKFGGSDFLPTWTSGFRNPFCWDWPSKMNFEATNVSSFYNQDVEIQPQCPIGTHGSRTDRTAPAGPTRAMGCPTANCGRLVPATSRDPLLKQSSTHTKKDIYLPTHIVHQVSIILNPFVLCLKCFCLCRIYQVKTEAWTGPFSENESVGKQGIPWQVCMK